MQEGPVFHLAAEDNDQAPSCGELREGDTVVVRSEANAPDGKWINCVECHKTLTGGQAHVPPPASVLTFHDPEDLV